MALVLGEGGTVLTAHKVEDRQAQKDESGADEGAFEVAGVAPDEHSAGTDDEDGGEYGVAPDAVGAREVGSLSAVEEYGCGGEHVEEPLSEDGEFEVLLKLREEEEQHGGE